MVREICKDEAFLDQKAEHATAEDLALAQDLLETLIAHKEGCVGMAANMIGVNKRIIAFDMMQPGSALSVAAAEAFNRHFGYAKEHFFAPQQQKEKEAAKPEQQEEQR